MPGGFTGELVTNAPAPTALAFLPDGRLLIATQPGRLHLQETVGLLGPAALDLTASTCSNLERGLLGVAVDPDFAANRFIYVFYTFDSHAECAHRVSRFRMADSGVERDSETVLIDEIPSANANHNAGDLAFGQDGHLYVSVGDGGCDHEPGGSCAGGNDSARDEHVLVGKILRITSDGGIPPDNPFLGPDADRCAQGSTQRGRRCQETFARGLRNPYRIAFDPDAPTTRFFINDVGQHHWEEINEGASGADYGWNIREGECPEGETEGCGPRYDGLTDPVSYPHTEGCGAITGGAFVPMGAWPDSSGTPRAPAEHGWDGAYLFGDYNCGAIFRLGAGKDGRLERQPFATGLGAGGPVHMAFGPVNTAFGPVNTAFGPVNTAFGPVPGDSRPALYYTSYARGGEVRRLSFTGDANRPPAAVLTAAPESGEIPLEVTFDASRTADPDGEDRLSFDWDFGDGTTVMTTSEPRVEHVYVTGGVHRAGLVVRDSRGAASAPVEIAIGAGRSAPGLHSSPPAGPFVVGEEMTLTASASDAEDGELAGDSVSWTLLLHHDDHTHPYLGPVSGGSITFRAPAAGEPAGGPHELRRGACHPSPAAGP